MKKIMAVFLGMMMLFGLATATVPQEAYASDDTCVYVTILNEEVCSNNEELGKKNGIYIVLSIVLDVLMAGVGVAAVIGIAISGVQYLTAGGNEAQMVKAKNRIIQVVIGLVIWALMWAGLNWLVPGGLF